VSEETKTMSAIGKRIWLYMQAHDPPYNRSALAKKWTRDGTFPTTAQSISNYLYREHPPPDFVNAIAREFELLPHEEAELHWLYFHGSVPPELTEKPITPDLVAKYELDQKGLQRRLERLEHGDFPPVYDEQGILQRSEEPTKGT
jgi:hypothetical protein